MMSSRRIAIQTISRPGIPNVNNVVYSKKAWDDIVGSIIVTGRKIPVTIGVSAPYASSSIPVENIIGYVSVFGDSYIIVDLLDYERIWSDKKLTVRLIDEYIARCHDRRVKAYMYYIGKLQYDMPYNGKGQQYIAEISHITHFNLGNADPRDFRPIEVDAGKHAKKRKK